VNAFTPNPFPGFRPFDSGDSHLFFGCEEQTTELVARLRSSRFVAVVGPAGSGKSSLVTAGLLQALHGGMLPGGGSRWRIAVMRPASTPIRNLALALTAPDALGRTAAEDEGVHVAFTEATLRRSSRGLVDVVRHARIGADENVLVVVDQFEDLFRRSLTRENEETTFIRLLLAAPHQTELPIYVVLTLRSEFVGECARFWELPEMLNAGLYLVPRMTRSQCAETITGPVKAMGVQIAPPLVSRLLNEVEEDQDQLVSLQHVLMRMWDRRANQSGSLEPIGFADYEAVGTMSHAIARHAEDVFAELPTETRELAERLFLSLTETTGDNHVVRRPTSVAELCLLADTTLEKVVAVLDRFRGEGRGFLSPPANVPLTADTVIDLTNEVLIRKWPRLEAWINEERRSAAMYLRLVHAARWYQQATGGLWRDPELELALKWRKEQTTVAWTRRYHPDVDAALRFLDLSERMRDEDHASRQRDRERRRRWSRALIAAGAAAVVLSAWLAYYAMQLAGQADAQRKLVDAAEAEITRLKGELDRQQVVADQRMKEAVDAARREATGRAP
jgi:hypothetical protein